MGQEAEAGAQYRRYVDAAQRARDGRGGLMADLDLKKALQWRDHTHHNVAWAERYGGYYEQTLGFLGDSEKKEIEDQRREYERLEEMAALQASRQAALEDSARKAKRISIGLVIGLVLAVVMGG